MDQYRPSGASTGVDVAARLVLQEHRLRALEAENHTLRRQLEELRRGVGIALVVDGRVLPVAVPPPSNSDLAPPTQPQSTPGVEMWRDSIRGAGPLNPTVNPGTRTTLPPAQAPVPSGYPRPGAAHPSSGPVPTPTAAPQHPRAGSTQQPSAQGAQSFDRLPVVRPLSTPLASQSHAAWLQSETAWPDPPPMGPVHPPVHPPAPEGPAAWYDPAALPGPSARPPAMRTRPTEERNIFADSFIL
ncbi:MAG: hypothetical protein PVSMB4_18950 [Ktedonobacterales bacterium]